ncbi:Protein GAMETE EXPRESSED 2 [Rhynchospora pubera]|uniref:Protein GAMETE EXPRESSED 2 n=1 Tax=Rhynchospora pubera TaxID=906938 RepID=A0AAV8D351_9POAL|nr:Protein GAMETE EXPRESSED 2 [Rhynchospora pubera]
MPQWTRMHCYCSLIYAFLWLLTRCLSQANAPSPAEAPPPSLTFSWLDDKSVFQAGDVAAIKVNLLQSSFSDKMTDSSHHSMNFSVSVNGKKGDSSFISGVCSNADGDPASWNITFIPIMAGEFGLLIEEVHFGIFDSSLSFHVTPGQIYPSGCIASWVGDSTALAGTKASILILPTDGFGNKLATGTLELTNQYFDLSISYENGSSVVLEDLIYQGWNEEGCIRLDFMLTVSGSFLVHVLGDKMKLRNSPLPLVIKPGPFDIGKSIGKWRHDTNNIRIFSKLELLIFQMDIFGNLVPGMHPFDARVVKKSSNLSAPIPDLKFQEVTEGTQLLSFTVSEQGDFFLTVFDAGLNYTLSHLVYEYKVFIGYCDGSKSFANGSGLASSLAGRMSSFMVFLTDQFNNSSPIKVELLNVQLISSSGGTAISPIVFPLRNLSDGAPPPLEGYFAKSPERVQHRISGSHVQTILGNNVTRASDFNVAYNPQKYGEYAIWIFCGNVPINHGRPYLMRVSPGFVDIKESSVIKFEAHVKISTISEVVVQLLDISKNPIISTGAKLSLQLGAKNDSTFTTYPFVEREDGVYHGYYIVREVGFYNVCVLLDDKTLSPCPFEVQVHEDKYFSVAYDDTVSVWEDESFAFDVLSNDYIAGGTVNITASIPIHGSLLRYGELFRYTPYKGYFGDDFFNYTIFDNNNNTATGNVFVFVRCKPPQFSSLPTQLNVTEEMLSPKFSEFGRIEMTYSDMHGNISVTIRAQSGTIFLAPISMQFLQPTGSTIAISQGAKTRNELNITGQAEKINSALQSVQYLGKENFYGNDKIILYAMNENGVREAHFSVSVEPINDPPIVNAPKTMFIGGKESAEGLQIFDKNIDTFEFSIHDPDIFHFPGNNSEFLLMLSLEIDEGELLTTLPVSIIGSAEFKSQNQKVWQFLQSYVTISKRFVLKGKGIRFRGTHLELNNALQQLFYKGPNQEAVLTVTVNDLGNYGCYPDCVKMQSSPLSTQVLIHLNKRRPTTSTQSFLIIGAIIVEILMMVVLGGVLLFFMCRCMNDLYGTRKDSNEGATTSPLNENLMPQKIDTSPVQHRTYSLARSSSQVRQRSQRRFDKEPDMVELQPVSTPPHSIIPNDT